MELSFEDYCEDYLDLHIALMSEDQLKNARAGYADLVGKSKSPAEIAKREKALEKAKESRKLAKFYGGKALTGSAAQKNGQKKFVSECLNQTNCRMNRKQVWSSSVE